MQKTKMKLWGGSMLSTIGIGLGTSTVLTILCASIGALLIYNEYLKPQTMIYVSTIIQFVATFAGALTAGKLAGENILPICALVGVSYFAVLFAVALLFFEGIAGGVVWGILACSVGIGGAIMLCVKQKTPRRRKNRRMTTR